jgi:hypothetical protein
MGILGNLTDAEDSLRRSKAVSPATNSYEDVANIAWDLSSLNYEAKGADGWLNRGLGLTSLVNPLAWASTLSGVWQNEVNRNPDDNVLELAWKIGTGTLWGVVGGQLKGLQGFYEGGKSLAMAGILGGQKLIDDLQNVESTIPEGDVWDLSKTYDIGMGELLAYGVGQASRAVTGLTGDELYKQSGLEFLRSDFDVFNKQHTDLFEKDGQLNWITQPTNFAFEVFLDPSTYLGLGSGAISKVLKGGYHVSKGVVGSGMKAEKAMLQNVVEGKATRMDSTLEDLRKYDSGYAKQFLVSRGVQGDALRNMSYLLGQTDKDVADVADVFLAVQHADEDAMIRLVNKYGEFGEFKLTVDSLNGGGTIHRSLNGETFDFAYKNSSEFGEAFNTALRQYVDEATVGNTDYVKMLQSLTQATDETGQAVSVAINRMNSPIVSQTMLGRAPIIGDAITAVSNANTRFRTILLEDTGQLARIGLIPSNEKLPTIIKTIRKVGLASTKGFVDLNDLGTAAESKILSMIDEADIVTNGAIRQADVTTGKSMAEELMDSWRSAVTPLEKQNALKNFERKAFVKIAELNNVSDDITKRLWEDMADVVRVNQNKVVQTYREGNPLIRQGENILDLDEVGQLMSQTQNFYQSIDFKQVNNAVKHYGKDMLQAFDKTKQYSGDALRLFNSLWSFGILMRPARFIRERMANSIGFILSGQALKVLFSDNPWGGIRNTFYNMVGFDKRARTGRKLAKDIWDASDKGDVAKTKSSIKNVVDYGTQTVGRTKANIDKTRAKIQEELEELAEIVTDSGSGVLNNSERELFEELNLVTTRKESFHGSSTMPEEFVDENGFVALTDNLDDAREYARNSAQPRVIDDALTEEDYAKRKSVIDKRINSTDVKIKNIESRLAQIEARKQANDANIENGVITPIVTPDLVKEYTEQIQTALTNKDFETVRNILNDPKTPFQIIDKSVKELGLSAETQIKIIESGNISREGINYLAVNGKNVEVKQAANNALRGKKYVDSSADNVKAIKASSPNKPVVVENVNDLKNQIKSLKTQREKFVKESKELSKVTKFTVADAVDDVDPYAQRIINSTSDNEVIYYRLKGKEKWSTVTKEELATWDSKKVNRYQFEIIEASKSPKHTKVTTVGDDVDISSFNNLTPELRQILGVKNKAEFDELIANGSIRKNESLKQWASDNHVGRIIINENGKTTILALPKFIETPKNNPSKTIAQERIAKKTDKISKKIEAKAEENIAIRNREELLKLDRDVELLFKEISDNKNLKLEERLELFTKVQAKLNQSEIAANRIDARLQQARNWIEESTSWKKRQGQGEFKFKTPYGVFSAADFLNGMEGKIALGNASASDWSREVLGGIDVFRGTGGEVKEVILNPSDTFYWEMFAGYLKYFGKNDESFNLIAKKLGDIDPNLTPELRAAAVAKLKSEMVEWLKSNPAGKKYADAYKIGNKYSKMSTKVDGAGEYDTFEDFVELRVAQVEGQLYDPVILAAYNSGDITKLDSAYLSEIMKGREAKVVQGRNASSGQKLSAFSGVRKVMLAMNKFLVEDPQTFIENIPMARSFYQERFRDLYNLNAAKVGGEITDIALINQIRKTAYQDSINEMRKWLYNVQSKTRLTDALGTFMPFITAYTFTNRMFLNAAKDNPAGLLSLLSIGDKTVGSLNYVDSEGNATRDFTKASALVIPVAEPVRDAFSKLPVIGKFLSEAATINVSMKSLNVWYGGEIVPGVGPLIAISTNNFVNSFPTLAYGVNEATKPLIPGEEGLIKWILPFGTQDNVFKMLSPTWANQLSEIAPLLFGQEGGAAYIDSFGKVMAFESARYRIDPETYEPPTEESVREQVNGLWLVKILTSTSSPASFQVKTEADLYRKIHRQLTDKYGKDEADWLFMTKYPEYAGVIAGSTSNEFGLSPNIETFYGLENMQGVKEIFQYGGEEAKDMLGWAVNPSGTGSYDEWVYDYLTNQSAGIGEGKYYDVLSPAEMQDKAAAAPGWIEFNQFMGSLDAEAIERGVPVEQDKQLSAYKAAFIKQQREKYPEWAEQYGNISSSKFNQRADVVEQLMSDAQFMSVYGNRKGIEFIEQYIDLRKDIKEQLRSTNTTLASNKEAKRILEAFVLEAKSESLEFSEFYNRYFDGDTVI